MKKTLIISTLLMLFALIGCTSKTTAQATTQAATTAQATTTKAPTTTAQELKAPTDLAIEKGVVSFTEVEGATGYSLKVVQNGETVLNMSVSNGDSLASVLEDGDYQAQIKVKVGSKSSSFSDPVDFTIGVKRVDITTLNKISGEYLTSSDYVNMSGRHYYEESTERMYFYYTASGFKVSFTGTELKAELLATGYNKSNNEARLVVLVDGEVYPDGGTTIVLNKGMVAEYTLLSGLENTKHTVEVLKRSEASDNTCAIVSLGTDGNFETPEQDKEKKILVIGASGSAGYGNLATNTSVTKNTYNSDGLKAFSYLTARMFDTEVDMINASGWGVKWGWNSQSGLANIPAAFSKVGIDSNNSIVKQSYDYAHESYDLIIVNLGMNDFNAYISRISDATEKAAKIEEYKQAVKAFYNVLLSVYNCPIIIIHTDNLNKNAEGMYNEEIAKEINNTLASPMIYPIIIPGNGVGTNTGANSHANVQTHIWTADKIAKCMIDNLGWTQVRDNITFDTTRDQVN